MSDDKQCRETAIGKRCTLESGHDGSHVLPATTREEIDAWNRNIAEGRRLNALWECYRAAVIPPNAPSIQVEEMHKAFWAGASACFQLVNTASDLPEDEACVFLEAMDGEFEEHLAGLERQANARQS